MSTSGTNAHHFMWLKGVRESYGSLEAFPDAQTVRHMLRMLRQDRKEMLRIATSLSKEALAEWNTIFATDEAERDGYITELEGWLKAKGFEE